MEIMGAAADAGPLKEASDKLAKGDERGATRIFDRILMSRGADARTYLGVASACQAARRFDLVATYAERGTESTPAADAAIHAKLYGMLGVARQQLGDYDAAIRAHQAALHLDGEDPAILNNLAYAYAEAPGMSDKLDEAERMAREAVSRATAKGQSAEDLAIYLDTLGWILFKRGLPGEALINLTAAADAMPYEPDILYHLSRAFAATGRLDEAREMLERAVKTDPKHVQAASALDEMRRMDAPAEDGPRASVGASPDR
jgi:tetratricopeptide (TPR) repeat protein